MKILENEVKLSSSLYGDFCLVDGAYISSYPQLDRTWIKPPALKPDVKPLLKTLDRDNSSSIWCIELEGLKKKSIISFEMFLSYPEHVEESLRANTFCSYQRYREEKNNDAKSIVMFFVAKYIHWILRNRPTVYFYTYGDFLSEKTDITYCSTQSTFLENALINKKNLTLVKQIDNFDETGNNLVILKHNPEATYNRYIENQYIDSMLDESVKSFLNSL